MTHSAEDVIRELTGLTERQARKINDEPTGVTPGFHLSLGGAVLPNGKIRYVSGAAAGQFLFFGEDETTHTRNGGSLFHLFFNEEHINTGGYDAGAGEFHPPVDGIYRFHVSTILVPSATILSGEKLYLQLWPNAGGTGIMDLATFAVGNDDGPVRDMVILQGFATRPCLATDDISIRFGNGTSNDVDQWGANDQLYATTLTVERVA